MTLVANVSSGKKMRPQSHFFSLKLYQEIYCKMKRGFQFVWSKNSPKVFVKKMKNC